LLNGLGAVYIQEHRMEDARETLSGLAILERAPDADPWDRIKLLKTRGALCARQGDWNAAEQDLGNALSIADHESRVDPVVLRPLLIDYAAALRKNHQRREARLIETRLAVLGRAPENREIVDVSERLPRQERRRCLLLAIALPTLAQEYVISTFAGGVPPPTPVPGVNMPIGLVQSVAADGTIATIAGTGDCGLYGDGGPAVAAQLCGPTGIASDSAGNLFITDSDNNRIRKITTDGTVATVAGKSSPDDAWPSGDGGPAASAGLYLPSNVAVDQAGNLYVADTYEGFVSGDQVVRKISAGGTVTTVAGLPCFDETPGEPPLCGADGTTAAKTFLGGPAWLGSGRRRQLAHRRSLRPANQQSLCGRSDPHDSGQRPEVDLRRRRPRNQRATGEPRGCGRGRRGQSLHCRLRQ
jgi:hypothetical protein